MSLLPPWLTRDVNTLEQTCIAHARAVPLPDGVILCRVLGRPYMYVDGRDRTIVPHLLLGGFWERHNSLIIARTVKEGWYCLDLGSNCGYFTLLLAMAAGRTGRVLGVEPFPRLAELSRWSIEVNGLERMTSICEAAVSDRVGETVTLVTDPHRWCNSSIMRSPTGQESVIDVQTTTVDELTKEWSRCDFIKCDIESAEIAMWDGMQRTLARFPSLTILLEVNTSRYPDPEKFYRAIAEQFPLRYVDNDGHVRSVTLEQLLTVHPDQDWLLWLKKN